MVINKPLQNIFSVYYGYVKERNYSEKQLIPILQCASVQLVYSPLDWHILIMLHALHHLKSTNLFSFIPSN